MQTAGSDSSSISKICELNFQTLPLLDHLSYFSHSDGVLTLQALGCGLGGGGGCFPLRVLFFPVTFLFLSQFPPNLVTFPKT